MRQGNSADTLLATTLGARHLLGGDGLTEYGGRHRHAPA